MDQEFLDSLYNPLSDREPCGVNIRQEDEYRDLYYRLKDARTAARSAERHVVPGEPLRLAPQWAEVRTLALEALGAVTRDLEVLAWLAEAEVRLHGLNGLSRIFRATERLVRDQWDYLHSIDADSIEDKVAPWAGLNGVGGEGTLIQPLRLLSLTPGGAYYSFSLWDYQMAQRSGEEARRRTLQDAIAEAGHDAMRRHLGEVTACAEAFDALTQAFNEACGAASPPSSHTRNILSEIAAAIRSLTGLSTDDAQVAEKVETEDAATAAVSSGQISLPSKTISSREEAFDQMLRIAQYFRQAEPHSPISHAIETLVKRGRMDFVDLLRELMPDPQTRKSILLAAGIQAQPEG